MHAGLLYALDDVAIEVSTHQSYLVAVVGQREAECRTHYSRPQNAYSRHGSPSQKGCVAKTLRECNALALIRDPRAWAVIARTAAAMRCCLLVHFQWCMSVVTEEERRE